VAVRSAHEPCRPIPVPALRGGGAACAAARGAGLDVIVLIWKDPRQGHWWLQLGSGALVGYWPSSLFTHLGSRNDMVQFGSEVVNARPAGAPHTPTQMGSGRFPGEGYARAAYFRNVQVVDWDNSLVPAAELWIRTAAAAVEIRRRPSLSPSCLHGATVLSLSRWSSSSPAASVRGLDGGPARRRRSSTLWIWLARPMMRPLFINLAFVGLHT